MKKIINNILYSNQIQKNRIIKKQKEMNNINNILKIPYPLKDNYNIIIPTNIFQTWHSKIIPPLMANSIKQIRLLNPRFNYYLYDDNDCRDFIKNHFKPDVLDAYDRLIPGAYKADLWRYCILFIKGGIYLDIKYTPINSFKFINLTESEHLAADINNVNIYNAIMVCLPKNEILFKAIRQIVENVKNKFYGNGFLDPTGPALLSKYISTSDTIVDLKHKEINGDNNNKIIYFHDIPILKSYQGHEREKQNYSIKKHYSELWRERKVYL